MDASPRYKSVEELMRSRRSVRRFRPEPPARETVERLLAAAVTAPSASNKQPWRFFIVERRSAIEEMARVVRQVVQDIAAHVPPDSQEAFRAYGEYFTRFEQAPIVIVPIFRGHTVLSNLVDDALDGGVMGLIEAMERDSALIGTSLALMNMLLMAQELGLGASVMTGPLVAVDQLKTILSIPRSWGVVALVPIGLPAETPAPTDRKSIAKVVRYVS